MEEREEDLFNTEMCSFFLHTYTYPGKFADGREPFPLREINAS